MNNNFVLTPRDAKDYGVYVCHATNSSGSTAFEGTLSEGHRSSTSAETITGEDGECRLYHTGNCVFGVSYKWLRRGVKTDIGFLTCLERKFSFMIQYVVFHIFLRISLQTFG